ncbi:hypothetical protein RMSM_06637, partial [Rhodopirellula maiorica SM1]
MQSDFASEEKRVGGGEAERRTLDDEISLAPSIANATNPTGDPATAEAGLPDGEVNLRRPTSPTSVLLFANVE